MGVHLPGVLKGAGLAAALLAGALVALPGHAGAQAPVNATLYGVTSSASGSGLVTLSGYNSVAVTLNGGAYGATYNVYSCTSTISTPTTPTCQMDGALYVNSGGQATGAVPAPVSVSAITEVFVQNATNTNELYAAVFVGVYPGSTTAVTSTPAIVCNGINVFTGQPICVVVGGGVLPWWFGGFGFNMTGFNTVCVVGRGLQPVDVNGTIVWEFC